jgi:RND family efflux transporter MFP subunit
MLLTRRCSSCRLMLLAALGLPLPGLSQPAATPVAPLADAPTVAPVAPATIPGGPLAVRVVQPRPADAEPPLRLPARTAPWQEAAIFSRASGFISERRLDLGSRVEAGTVLAVIATPERDAEAREVRARLEQAEAAAALAQVSLQRAESLAARGMVAAANVDERRAASQVATAAVAAQQAALARVEDQRRFSIVRAPFAGRITERTVEHGDRVSAEGGTVPLFRIARLDKLRVLVDVPQAALAAVRPGTEASLTLGPAGGLAYPARVARMAGTVDPRTGAMRVELDLDNPGETLPAGMLGELTFGATAAVGVLVPNAAIVIAGGTPRAMVVGADQRVTWRPLTLGANRGAQTEVRSGLVAADRVVLNPNAALREGDTVKVLAEPEKKP